MGYGVGYGEKYGIWSGIWSSPFYMQPLVEVVWAARVKDQNQYLLITWLEIVLIAGVVSVVDFKWTSSGLQVDFKWWGSSGVPGRPEATSCQEDWAEFG